MLRFWHSGHYFFFLLVTSSVASASLMLREMWVGYCFKCMNSSYPVLDILYAFLVLPDLVMVADCCWSVGSPSRIWGFLRGYFPFMREMQLHFICALNIWKTFYEQRPKSVVNFHEIWCCAWGKIFPLYLDKHDLIRTVAGQCAALCLLLFNLLHPNFVPQGLCQRH